MKHLGLSPLFFRRIHKWIGLILGLQFILWTLSGAMMALIDHNATHRKADSPAAVIHAAQLIDPASLPSTANVEGLALRMLGDQAVYELQDSNGARLFDAKTGVAVTIDANRARTIATAAYPAPIRQVQLLNAANLEVRPFEAAVWRIDFNDAENSTAYIARDTGRVVALRGDAWRVRDFFWMLHTMDYARRTDFNHPLIIFTAFGVLWLSITGVYLLFTSFRRNDFRWIKRRTKPSTR